MASARATVNRIRELERNGFEKKQATVLAMAIDETVGDRLSDVMSRIDARFDAIDAQFRAIDERFEGINAKLDSRKYQIAVIVAASLATLPGICVATYVYLIRPLLG